MKLIKISLILAMTMMLAASCLNSDSTSSTTLYDDAVVTDFTLGTLNKYASDSTKTTFSASSYLFNIDQNGQGRHTFKDTTVIGRCIYNTDSLPKGTDLHHVLGTLSTLNNGIALIELIDEPDSYMYFSSSDSIDYSKPRKIRVYSSDAKVYNDYYISVEAHQEDGSEFVWKYMGDGWRPEPVEETNLPAGIKRLLGSCTTEQYALSDDGYLMVSYDKGVTWQEEVLPIDTLSGDTVPADIDKIPMRDLSLISYPVANADSVDYVLLVGNREVSEQNDEAIAMVWRKVVDYGKNAPKAYWTYMERDADSDSLALPRLEHLTMVKYDDGILAFGGKGIGGCTREAYSQIYQSRDNGITWKENPSYTMPEEDDGDAFDTNVSNVWVSVDDDNFIWLHCEGTGQVWRGRLNRLGWKIQN